MRNTIDAKAAELAVPSAERTTAKAYGLPRVHAGHRRAYVQGRCVAVARRTVAAITAEALRERAASVAREARVTAAQIARNVVPVGAGGRRARRATTRAARCRVTRRGRARAAGCDAPGDA